MLDRYQPGEHALTVLEMIRHTLAEICDGEADAAILSEFPQHWLGNIVHVALPPNVPEGSAELYSIPRGKDRALLLLTRDAQGLSVFPEALRRDAMASCTRAWVVRCGTALHFAKDMVQPENFADLLAWAAACEPGLDTRLLLAAKNCFKRRCWLFVMAPNGCVGAQVKLPPLIDKSIQTVQFYRRILDIIRNKILVTRWSGTPMHTDFIFDRNLGTQPGLAGRSVVLVGCGTIGSHLAKFLAQSGAGHLGNLILVDPDTMSPGNIGRHWLGPGQVGQFKADACRDELKAMFPSSNIRSIAESILDRKSVLAKADLVIDATGEEALSLALNEILVRKRPLGPAAIHVWLIGNGAAAQCLLVRHNSLEGCCLKCIRTSPAASSPYWPLVVGEETQPVAATCGEAAFVPYGVAAPAIAAAMALKACLDWSRNASEPNMRTIRVEFGATVEVPDTTPKPIFDCPACGQR
ncbi:ThiF family adenylyltransferase [Gluconobacter sp. Dm-74]|uniref:ThiF family adenylyltransferase n=1 Tax=Gluconobacter sp. Dm-74 TaxID=2799803 RepID=UPI001B8CA2D8|nr:ThiF family adenylyltransferase [Gluconobacter sp. Dm-74]